MKITLKKHRSIHFCFMLSLFSILISDTLYIQYAQAATTTVSVYPSPITASVGQNFSIDVAISNVLDLYGWEFKLSWNATLLDAVSAVEGSFLKTGGQTFFTYKVNATAGYVIVDCTLLGSIRGVSGTGTLATITFYVKNVGECALDLYDVTLLNSLEQPIPCQTVDGYGYFTYPHDIAITNVSASPIIVLPGDIVNINVAAQNQGGFAEVFNVTANVDSQVIGVQSVSLESGSSRTINFTWNTTGFGKGDYIVSASASIVPNEVETTDNSKTSDSPVTILYQGHDVAVNAIVPSKTVVGQGYSVLIAVTIKNYGIYIETLNVILYVNETAFQTQTLTLESGNSTSITFTWNTSGFVMCNYTLRAYAEPVPNETITVDNELRDGTIYVGTPGDINGNGTADIFDAIMLSESFGSESNSLNWKPNADINGDNIVDIFDAIILGINYGK